MREALIVMAAVSLIFGTPVNAQVAAPATEEPSSGSSYSDPTAVNEIACNGQRGASITLRRPGLAAIVLDLDGGNHCAGDSHYGSPLALWIYRPSQASVRTQNCPGFRSQSAKLQPSSTAPTSGAPVQFGAFTITDWAGFFHLRSPKGRQAAVNWVKQTLAVVRPCWEISDQDLRPTIVNRLYVAIGMRP